MFYNGGSCSTGNVERGAWSRCEKAQGANKPRESQDTDHVESEHSGDETYTLFTVEGKQSVPPLMVDVEEHLSDGIPICGIPKFVTQRQPRRAH